MNNFTLNKGSKYRDKLSFKSRPDNNPTLTEKSTEKTLENHNNNDNSISKKSFFKNTSTNININKTSKSTNLSEKDLFNLQTQKSKSKENSRNKNFQLKFKNNNQKDNVISSLFKDIFPKYLNNSLKRKVDREMKKEGKFINKLSLEKKPKSYLNSIENRKHTNSKEISPNFSTNFNDKNDNAKKISKNTSGVATPVHRYTRSEMNYKSSKLIFFQKLIIYLDNMSRKVIPTVASLGNNINNNNNKNVLYTKKTRNPSTNIINLQNHNYLNSQNIYGINQQTNANNNKASNSSKVKPFKNELIINNNNIINNNFNNINNIYPNNANNNNNNNNQNNLINLNGINISYSELAKHLHSRKNTAVNTKAKNSNENSLEKMHSSAQKMFNKLKQPTSFKILPKQNEKNNKSLNYNNYKNFNNNNNSNLEKEKENEKESTPEKNVLLTQDCFFNNSFKKKKRNSSLKYNLTHGFNNISQIFKNSSSNLNTSNSISNINAPNLGGSCSFANNSKTTKENSILNSMANTMKGSNFFNFPSNNSFANTSLNNLNHKSSINFKCGNSGNNRNAFSRSNFLNNLNNNNNNNNNNKLNNNLLSYNDSIKHLNFGRTNNPNDIEGPELLHFFYVNILQQNKKLAFKFENCEEENSVIVNENQIKTFN